ncbi:MFS transporter [Pseudomonas sp. R5(2019)]|uniref:MFS transporter n=1 Tax=Pseudomonas sp. R5(2019) TaxID=2697566 RepID=UPI001411F564|nr:MFS transporter [Pseudomonas sp. R5(2019)]NBA97315.1 MFS transporter [Pseudomonas sp. R5(2019)]
MTVPACERDTRLGTNAHRLLLLIMLGYAGTFLGRQIMSVMIEPIKREFAASDAQMGLISGLAFALVYAFAGLPAGRLADSRSRVRLLLVSMLLWALATLLSGVASGFAVLVLARMLTAVAEAPVTPASLSLIADLYPPRNRSLAISCFTGAPTLSAVLGLSVGAWIVEQYGWRSGFLAITAPVLLVTLGLHLFGREPARGRWDIAVGTPSPIESLTQAALSLMRNRPYLLLMLANALATFSAFALSMWNTSFLMRSHDLPLQHAGILAGVVGGCSAALGGLVSGWLSDRLGNGQRLWLLRVPLLGHALGLGCLLAYLLWPAGVLFEVGGVPVPSAMLWGALAGFFGMWWIGASYNLLTQLVNPWQRATAVALQTVFSTLCGAGLGPLVTGLLSDWLVPGFGEESLRYALALVSLSLLVPMGLLVAVYISQRSIPSIRG